MRKQLLILSIRCHCVKLLTSSLIFTQAYKKCIQFFFGGGTGTGCDNHYHHHRQQKRTSHNKQQQQWRAHSILPASFTPTICYYFRHGMHQFVDVLAVFFFALFCIAFSYSAAVTESISHYFSLSRFSYLMKEKSPVEIN